MLKVLLEQKLSNVLIIVTRYFGGTLLGTGGLVRAYSGALIDALQKVEYIKKQDGYVAEFEVNYDNFEQFKYFCNKNSIKITNIEYKENIKLFVEICRKTEEEFTKNGNREKINIINHKIVSEKYVDK